jgi:hypothetical protein
LEGSLNQAAQKILNVEEPQKVTYCCPLEIRDEQVRLSTRRIKGRIEGYPEGKTRPEPIAIVCYGPSLNNTWKQIKKFDYIMTGSGSHKFLIDKGFKPSDFKEWKHLEVDPREHKATLLGTPQEGIEYLIASCCHPKVFDLLEDFDIKLWHVFSNEEQFLRTLPRGDWAITGGSNVGLRQMTVARFLGFNNLHIFGMDGCEGKSGKHAAEHPNQPQESFPTPYKGKIYQSTPAMVECARQTFHELNQMPDVKAKFYGRGLVQAMAKDYKPEYPKDKPTIACQKPELISEEYRKLNADLHTSNAAYGIGGSKHVDTVKKLAESCKPRSVLDYGSGKGYLAKALDFPIWEYDPAIPGKDESPRPADLVVCTDVLEHIEPTKLIFVLDDLRRCTKQVGYFVIHTGPAMKKYTNGQNTHLIQQGRAWWEKRLSKFFKVAKIFEKNKELHVIVGPKK